MFEEEKLIQEIRSQLKSLEALLHYLESRERFLEEDESYCRSTLRRVGRELSTTSRGRLVSLDTELFRAA